MTASVEVSEADSQPLQPGGGNVRVERPSRCARVNRIRRKIDEFIHDRKVEIAILVLIILDALIVLFELLIDLKIFGEHVKEGKLPEALHIISIVTLSFFMIEVFLKIFALGRHFFKSPMNIIDGIIVIVSFVMDILFMNNEEWHDLIGLLIVLRLWRIVRIVNGIVQTVREQYEMKLEHKDKTIEKLEAKIKDLKEKLGGYGYTVESDEEVENKPEELKEEVPLQEDVKVNESENIEIEMKVNAESEDCTVEIS